MGAWGGRVVKEKASLTHGLGMWTAHKGREKEPEPVRDRKRQLTKEPRRRTTSAPRHPAALLVHTSLPGNVGFQESATTREGTGKGVQWGSELSLCRTSCPGLKVVLLLVAVLLFPISSHKEATALETRSAPGLAHFHFVSWEVVLSRVETLHLLGSGTGPSGGHKGTVGSPGKPPGGMAHLPLLILELGLNGSRARIPRS